jgi:hypothetical protein
MHLVQNHFPNFGTPNITFRHETQVLHLFTCQRFPKCSKRHPNIIWGPMEYNGCIWCEIIFATSVHRTQVLHLFNMLEVFQKLQKENKTSFGVQWSKMDAFGVKPFF